MNQENKDNETKIREDVIDNDSQIKEEPLVPTFETSPNETPMEPNPLEGVKEPVLEDTPLIIKEEKGTEPVVENTVSVESENPVLSVEDAQTDIPRQEEAPVLETPMPSFTGEEPKEDLEQTSISMEIPNLTESNLPEEEKVVPGLPQIEIENQAEGMLTEEIPVIPPTTIENQPNIAEEKPKKKSKKGMIIGIILVLLVAILVVCYFLFFSTKNLFLAAVNKEYGNIVSNINTLSNDKYKLAKDSSMVTKGNFKISMDANTALGTSFTGVAKELSKLNGTYTFGTDYKNKKISALLSLNYDKDAMLNINTYGTNQNLYAEFKNLFAKYISFPMEEYDALFTDPNVKVEDMKTMVKTVKNAFLDALDSKDFKKESVTTKIGEKEEKVTKISYAITENNIHKLYESILNKLKNDKNFVSLLASYTSSKEETVKENMEKAITEYKNKKILGNNSIEMNVYTKGLLNTAVKYGIIVNEIGSYETNITQMTYAKADKKNYIEIMQNNKEAAHIVIEEKNKDKYLVTVTSGEVSALINITKENDTYKADYAITDSDNTNKITGTFTSKETKNDKKYDGTGNFTLEYELSGTKYFSLKAENTYQTTIGETVEVPEIKSSVRYDQLTDKDANAIIANLMQNPALMSFVTNIMAYIY